MCTSVGLAGQRGDDFEVVAFATNNVQTVATNRMPKLTEPRPVSVDAGGAGGT